MAARAAALLALGLSATTFVPLVSGPVWLIELLVVVAVAALSAAAAQRWWSAPWGPPVSAVVLVWMLCMVYATPESVLGVVPGPTTMQLLLDLAASGADEIATSAAPVDATPSLRLVVVAALALVWWVVDVVAVVLVKPALAGLALLAVYCVPAALVAGGLPWWWFVLAASGYLVLVASDARQRVARWGRVVRSNSVAESEAPTSLVATGRRVGALALASAVLVPALVPGLSESLLPSGDLPGDTRGGGSIAVLNPILSLREDLVANDDTTVLEYTTTDPTPEPLRLVTVDTFDGDTWGPTYGDIDRDQRVADGFPAPPGLSSTTPATRARMSITIAGLRQGWLPTPYPPTRIDVRGDWLYDESTLNVVGDDVQTSEGLRYSLEYVMVEPSAEVLATAPPPPADVVERWTRLPAATPGVVRATAERVAGTGTDLDRATRLQSWFRSGGGFRYTLDAPSENGSSAVADFLVRRSGYCVHFASAMALMARSLGIPARVAVGWLPGEQTDPGRYRITQQDAHAWPELYFEGAGWTRFEPTPATRAGSVPEWAAPTTTQPSQSATPSAPTTTFSASAPTAHRETDAGASTNDTGLLDALQAVPWRILLAILLALVMLSAPAVAAVVVRRRRWTAATTPAARAEAAWTTTLERLGDLGLLVPTTLTIRQVSRLVSNGLHDEAAASVRRLAAAVERQRYAPPARTVIPERVVTNGSRPGAVLDLDAPPAADQLGDRGLQHDVRVVVRAVAGRRSAVAVWRARLAPRSGRAHLWTGLGRAGTAVRQLQRALRVGRRRRR